MLPPHEEKTQKDPDFLYLTCEPPVYQCASGSGDWPDLEIEKELQTLLEVFDTDQKSFVFAHEVATSISFPFALSRGARVLHLSGHCDEQYGVALEKEEDGLTYFLDSTALSTLLKQDKALRGVKLVFISACYSESIGRAFVEGGVKHVICIEGKEEVLDSTSITFTRILYENLKSGSTVNASFKKAKAQIKVDVHATEESRKYLLLPEVGDHDVAIWPKTGTPITGKFTRGDSRPPAFALPNAVENFFGRKSDLHYLLQEFHRPLIVINGRSGMGKTAFVIRALHYISRRSHSSDLDSVAFIRLDRSNDAKDTPITWQVAQHFRDSPKESDSKVADISIEELCKLIKEKISAKNMSSGRKKKALLVFDGLLTLDQSFGVLIDRLLEDTPVKIIITCVSIIPDSLKNLPLIQTLHNLNDLEALKLFHRLRGLLLDPTQSNAIHICYEGIKAHRFQKDPITKKDIMAFLKKSILEHDGQEKVLSPLVESVWLMLKFCKGYPQRICTAAKLITSNSSPDDSAYRPVTGTSYDEVDFYTETGGLLQLPKAMVKAASQILDMIVTGSRSPGEMLPLFVQQKYLAATPSFLLESTGYKDQKEEMDKIWKELKFPGSLKKLYNLANDLVIIRLEFVRNLEIDYTRRCAKTDCDSSPHESERRGTLVGTDWQRLRDKIQAFKGNYASIIKERIGLAKELSPLTLFCDLVIAYRQRQDKLEKIYPLAKAQLGRYQSGTVSSVLSPVAPDFIHSQIEYALKRAKVVLTEIEPVVKGLRSALSEAKAECIGGRSSLTATTRTKLQKALEEAKHLEINYPEVAVAEDLLQDEADLKDTPIAPDPRVFVFPPSSTKQLTGTPLEMSPQSPPLDRSYSPEVSSRSYRPIAPSQVPTPLHTPLSTPLPGLRPYTLGRKLDTSLSDLTDELPSTTISLNSKDSQQVDEFLSTPHFGKSPSGSPVLPRSSSASEAVDMKKLSQTPSGKSVSPFPRTRSMNQGSVGTPKEESFVRRTSDLGVDYQQTDDEEEISSTTPQKDYTSSTLPQTPPTPQTQSTQISTLSPPTSGDNKCIFCGLRTVEELFLCGLLECRRSMHAQGGSCKESKAIFGGTAHFCHRSHYTKYFRETYQMPINLNIDRHVTEIFTAKRDLPEPYRLLSDEEKQEVIAYGCSKNLLSDTLDPHTHRKILNVKGLWTWFTALVRMLPSIYPIWSYTPRLIYLVQREKADQMLSVSRPGTLLLRASSFAGFLTVDFKQTGHLPLRTLCKFSETGEMTIWHAVDKDDKQQKYASLGEYVMKQDRIKYLWPNIPKETIFTSEGNLRPIKRTSSSSPFQRPKT